MEEVEPYVSFNVKVGSLSQGQGGLMAGIWPAPHLDDGSQAG